MVRRLVLPALSVLGLFACSLEDREFPPANPRSTDIPVVAAASGAGTGGQGGSGGNGSSSSTSSSSSSASAGGDGGGGGAVGAGILLYPFCGCVEAANSGVQCEICLWDPVVNGCAVEEDECSNSTLCDGIRSALQLCQTADQQCMDDAVNMHPGGGDTLMQAYLQCACASCNADCPEMFCQ